LGVRYEALVKKAKKIMVNSRLAFQYSNHKPDSFLKLAEGRELDRSAYLALAPGAVAQHLGKGKAKSNGKKAAKPKATKEKGKKAAPEQKKEPKFDQHKNEQPLAEPASNLPDLAPSKDSLQPKNSDQNQSGEQN
jgi:hypothetical protein